MYYGKHAKQKRTGTVKKSMALLAALLVLLTIGVGSTLAYLVTQTNPVKNVFTPGTFGGTIEETFDGETKKDVSIQIDANSNVNAYVRAAIVVTWKDGEDGVYGKQPLEGTDYTMILNRSDWFDGDDGYYYCKTPVVAGENSPVLIETCTQTEACEEEQYRLDVEILAEAVQSTPKEAVEDAWGKPIADQLRTDQ